MTNTTEDTLYMVGLVLFIPRELYENDIKLYKLIYDTLIYNDRFEYEEDLGRVDGFSNGAIGEEIITRKDTLVANESFDFTFRMTIEPLLDKFEIYPMYLVSIETKGERIWPTSIITVDGQKYKRDVHYVKFCDLAIPTYILFSINNGELKVVSPNELEPTFKP